MTKLPKLYAKSSMGALLEWEIFIEGNSYYSVHGQVGGKLITGASTVCHGKNLGKKNATSPEEQAEKEAAAEHKKKMEQGGYVLDIDDVDQDAYFSPQLSKEWEDYKDKIDLSLGHWCVSPKLDGLRAVESINGAFSRNGKEFKSFPHINDLLQPLYREYPDLIVDGEIYCHAYKHDFNEIISLAKKSKPTTEDLQASAQTLEFWVFDHSYTGGCDLPFAQRLKNIQKWVKRVGDSRIKYVPHAIVKHEDEVKEALARWLEEGYEGVMLKNLQAPYQNKRTKNLLKYKLFKDEEFVIMDIIEGVGARSGMFGYASLVTHDGRKFDSNARGNEAFYRELLQNRRKYIGKLATVRFQNYTPDGVPRFPVIVGIRNYE